MLYLSQSTKEFYRLAEFHLLPRKHGLYAWFVSWSKTKNAEDFYRFYKAKRLSVKISANLREKYYGTLQCSLSQDLFTNVDRELLELATMKFSPPIYIGMAKDQTLRDRLNDHKRELIKLLNDPYLNQNSGSSFMERVRNIIRQSSLGIDETDFYVRVVSVESQKKSEVRKIETLINRTFHPIYGSK